MSDYISRAELDRIIHLLHTECAYDMPSFDSKNGYKVIPTRYHKGYQQSLIDLESRIAELPSADVRENRWIPVSEKLPENHEEVLIYLSSNRITIGLYNSHVLPLAPYKPIGWGVNAQTAIHNFCSDDVVAWMPLPEPYKADMRGET